MCTLAIYYKTFADYPVVVAANRDEYLARAALPPTTLAESPHIIGGKDLRASGTWLGINQHGIVAGLLNRRNGTQDNDPGLRSRGLLCLDALRHSSADEAREFVERQRGSDYNPFNLLIASRDAAFVAYNRWGTIETVRLTPGLHLLTNLNLNDFECPRISRSYSRFAELGAREDFARDPLAMRAELGRLLADHSTQLDPRSGRPNSLCLHLSVPLPESGHTVNGDYGTRSSSLIFMRAGGPVEHFFAAGPPCTTSYEPAIVPRPGPAAPA
ncbi:MAG TPA: NRDE family protein [Candidatus Binataceae bacterium]|nr:NRDE family protein [Candidatus Binataceae bacterium]